MSFNLNALSVKYKIVGTSLLTAAICLAISYFGETRLVIGMDSYRRIADVNFKNMVELGHMEQAAIQLEAAANLLIGSNSTPEDVKHAAGELEEGLKLFEEAAKVYEALPFADGEEAVWKEFKSAFWHNYEEHAERIISLSRTGQQSDRDERDRMAAAEWTKLVEARNGQFDKLTSFQKKDVETRMQQAEAMEKLVSWLIPVLMLGAVLLSTILSLTLGSRIASGIMTIAGQLEKSSEEVAKASQIIAASSHQLSQSSSEQAASLEETASSLEQITSMISKASENADSSAAEAKNTQTRAEEGRRAMDNMLISMNEISESNQEIMQQIENSNSQMREIVQVIQEIGNKTKVINEIVFQTKLLSFNASVEAARAGEHGKGFAVVAEEVGNLAQMSGNAAREISDMLNTSIAKVQAIVNDTSAKVESLAEQGKKKVTSGVEVAKACAKALSEIVENVAKVTVLAQEISQANREQSLGVGEINKAMSQLDTVTQQNAASSESAASSAEELSGQSQSLRQAVSDLMAAVNGSSTERDLSKAHGKGTSTGRPLGQTVAAKAPPRDVPATPSNVIPLRRKSTRPENHVPHADAFNDAKVAVGQSDVPSRDDGGFSDF